jgi:small nuclear ribonucleoprotein (snRNP)-like protein
LKKYWLKLLKLDKNINLYIQEAKELQEDKSTETHTDTLQPSSKENNKEPSKVLRES